MKKSSKLVSLVTMAGLMAGLTVGLTVTSTAQASDAFFVASDDDLSATIQKLSTQAQQKEDRLAQLAQTMTNQPVIYRETTTTTVGYGLLAVRPISSSAKMSSGFGYRYLFGATRMHEGMDFAAPIGTPIYATGDGIVTYSGPGTGYGRYVEIDHGNGLVTRYGHTSRNFVNVGDRVYANQHIADVGNEGRSTGPHLHYEVRRNGVAVNPNTYLALAPAR